METSLASPVESGKDLRILEGQVISLSWDFAPACIGKLWGSGSGRPGAAAVAAFKLGDRLSGHFGAERGAFLS